MAPAFLACNSLLQAARLRRAHERRGRHGACNSLLLAPPRLAETAPLVVRPEEVLAPGGRHRCRGADLEAERGGGDDLGEAVHLARAGAADRGEPVARRRERGAAADRADLEAAEADRGLEPAVHAPARPV